MTDSKLNKPPKSKKSKLKLIPEAPPLVEDAKVAILSEKEENLNLGHVG